MRKITIAICAIGLVAASCHNSAPIHKASKPDTLKVNSVFQLGDQWRRDTSFRIIRDTFRLSSIDTSGGNAKMEWRKDTLYFIPIVTDTVNKKVSWVGVPPAFVQEIHVKPLK